MEEGTGPGHAHMKTSGATSSCRPFWSAFVNARADAPHPPGPLACRDVTRIERDCRVEKDAVTGHDILHCHETREKFRVCSNSLHTDANRTWYDRQSKTTIETREPLPEGQALMAPDDWETVLSRHEASAAADPASTLPLRPHVEQGDVQLQSSASGRPFRPWLARADDGGSDAQVPSSSGNAALMTPEVGLAVDEIISFADEMQRDLAMHGLELLRRGQEEQQRRKQPGLLARLFGARGNDGAKDGLAPGGVARPYGM